MMSRRRGAVAALLAAGMLLVHHGTSWAQADNSAVCAQAAQDAERASGLPAGLLTAIASVESGGWPWTANLDGVAERYQSKADAIAALTRVRMPKPVDVDVGCFQISLKYHPTAFATMADALDPAANARYAARFLLELHDRYGAWDRAAAAYHSATAPLGADYQNRVMASWKGQTAMPPPEIVPVSDGPRWRIISIAAAIPPVAGMGALPHIITLKN